MIESKLYTVIYEVLDDGKSIGDLRAFNTVGVDMDLETAIKLSIEHYKSGYAIEGTEDEELSDDFFERELDENYHWLECPDVVDGFEITVTEKQQ